MAYIVGRTNLVLCCSGQKTFEAGLVGRFNSNNNSHVITRLGRQSTTGVHQQFSKGRLPTILGLFMI